MKPTQTHTPGPAELALSDAIGACRNAATFLAFPYGETAEDQRRSVLAFISTAEAKLAQARAAIARATGQA